MLRPLVLVTCLLCTWVAPVHAQVDNRVVYLSPVDGNGSDAAPFESRCLRTPGGNQIDLRPNGAVATGRMLCVANALPANMTGVFQIASTFNGTVNSTIKNGIRTALGLANVNELTATTFDALLPQLLIDLPKAKPGLWKPLVAGKDGMYRVFLGTEKWKQTAALYPYLLDNGYYAEIWNGTKTTAYAVYHYTLETPVTWALTLATETFTATDGNLDGCQANGCTHSWVEYVGTELTISSNQAVATGSTIGSNASARNTSSLDTSNMTVSATFVDVTIGLGSSGTNTTCSLLSRKANDATQTNYRIVVIVQDAGELNETQLMKTVSGTSTTLATNTNDWVAGNVVTHSADGSTISGQSNASGFMSVTDTEITTGTHVGIRYFADYSSGSPSCIIDNLDAADITTAIMPRRRVS